MRLKPEEARKRHEASVLASLIEASTDESKTIASLKAEAKAVANREQATSELTRLGKLYGEDFGYIMLEALVNHFGLTEVKRNDDGTVTTKP